MSTLKGLVLVTTSSSFVIESGPSKERLIDALKYCIPNHELPVSFTGYVVRTHKNRSSKLPREVFVAEIRGVEYRDNSGYEFIVTAYGAIPTRRKSIVKFVYNTNTRKGFIKLD